MNTCRPPTSWDDIPIIIDLAYVAAYILAMNAEYLKKLAKDGKFPAFKAADRVWRVDKDELRRWIEERKRVTVIA